MMVETTDNYLLFRLGWVQGKRLYSVTLHLRLAEGKISVEQDWTDDFVSDLIMEGVSREDLVFAVTSPPAMRPLPEFAVARQGSAGRVVQNIDLPCAPFCYRMQVDMVNEKRFFLATVPVFLSVQCGKNGRVVVGLFERAEPCVGLVAIRRRSEAFCCMIKSSMLTGFERWAAFGGDGTMLTNDRDEQRKIIKYNHLVANCEHEKRRRFVLASPHGSECGCKCAVSLRRTMVRSCRTPIPSSVTLAASNSKEIF